MILNQTISYIRQNGRLLEIKRLNHLLDGGSVEDILNALQKYQNDDGGFGHALEPDCWNPESSAIQSLTAITVMRTLNLDKSNPMIMRLFEYLESSFNHQTSRWDLLHPQNNNYPHAPWWEYRDVEPSFNPSASIAGFIMKYEDPSSPLYKDAYTVYLDALDYIDNTEGSIEMHELRCLLDMANDLYETHQFDPDYLNMVQRLIIQMRLVIEIDESKWFTSYSVKPSFLIKHHPSIGSDEFKELIFKEFELAISQRNSEGIWPLTWSWSHYPETFLKAKLMWNSIIAYDYIALMKAYGFIQ